MSSAYTVIKFGGTSVSNAARWANIESIIRDHLAQQSRLLVVCSAPAGASNMLERLCDLAVSQSHEADLQQLITQYRELADALEVDCHACLDESIQQLKRLLDGVSLIQEASFRVRAQVMSLGELMLTHLGAAHLSARGLDVAWGDARAWLRVVPDAHRTPAAQYLSVRCETDFDETLAGRLPQADVVITQGFIAQNAEGETVLLGRGGSDASAAYLAANLGATTCEIWTDVPGIYTANPRHIPQARLLRRLDYEEAREIASMGGKVLHPNCVTPLQQHNIPLYVKYTPEPAREGTLISSESDGQSVQIKSIITKKSLVLIAIETARMWQQVGFLADIFQCFKSHGLSIDLISTSETNVTVSLDRAEKSQDQRVLQALLDDLNAFSRAKLIGPCASVSLIGHNIRSILHQLGEVFSVFESQRVHLLSQAANDLNLTFVVDEDQVDRLAEKLHHYLIDQHPYHVYFSQTWQEEFGEAIPKPRHWWTARQAELLDLAKTASPCYVYDRSTLLSSAKALKACDQIDRIFYAMKANSHPDILKTFYAQGLHFECVSLEEVQFVLSLFPDISRDRILFTPNFAAKSEYRAALDLGVFVTVDNLYPLLHWPDVFKNQSFLVRIDPGQGAGHHKYVKTAGASSKFGIPIEQLDQLCALVEKNQYHIIGLHAHSGSGILQSDVWQRTSQLLTRLLARFPEVRYINLGGGLGIVERPGQTALDVEAVNASLQTVKAAFPSVELWLEPGRFLVAQSGVILAKVTQLKSKGDMLYVGIETGMNSLIRPALYGSYHEIVNLTRLNAPNTQMVDIVGPICESGDTLGYSRLFPETQEGDVILIANTGAYGYCMSSHYNMRAPAAEQMFDCNLYGPTAVCKRINNESA